MTQTDDLHHEDKLTTPLSANQPHRPADDSEEVYYEGSPLVRGAMNRAVWLELIGLLLLIAPLTVHYVMGEHIPVWLLVGSTVAGLIALCIPALQAMMVRYRVTNYRIDYERGLFNKDIDTLELWHIEDIHFHQSFRDRLLGIGSIMILSHDITTPRLELHSLPHSRHLFDQLKQRIIAVKRQRGVLKLDTGK